MIKVNDSIYFNISRVALLLRRDFLQNLKEFNITPEQWSIMAFLNEKQKPISQKSIVEHLLKDKHAVSKMINKMVKKEWIIKEADINDSRVTLISLTKKGTEDMHTIGNVLSKSQHNREYNMFPNEEKKMILNFLKQIRIFFNDIKE
ncbi:MAG: MarR family transcriptional regulator [Spirochaetaceae bacterium]